MIDSITQLLDSLRQMPWDSWQIVTILIVAGFIVGFINTLASSGAVITFSLFTFLGLPLAEANGSIRLGVIMQMMLATYRFAKHGLLKLKLVILLCIPMMLGAFAGAQISAKLDTSTFRWFLIGALLIVIGILFFKPKTMQYISFKKEWHRIATILIVFLILGVYAGFIHIGCGFFMIIAVQLLGGPGITYLEANAYKAVLALTFTPCALAIYAYHHQVNFYIGGIAMLGNVLGSYVASSCALKWGSGFIKWILAIVIVLFIAYLIQFY
jgi:hypothetical protein